MEDTVAALMVIINMKQLSQIITDMITTVTIIMDTITMIMTTMITVMAIPALVDIWVRYQNLK
jgi:hypothetical protein